MQKSKIRIRASKGLRAIDLRELWRHRELLYFLAIRDIKLRYKQTILGVGWAVLQPLATVLVFTVFFGTLGKMPSDGVPYALFVLAGLLPWQLLSYSLTQSSQSLVNEQRLITKVYFPRLLIPVASALSGLVDFLVILTLSLSLVAVYGITPSWAILWIPLFALFVILAAVAAGLWLSALNVKYRDVRYTLPFITQIWLFASPVAYPSSIVPEEYRSLYGLNPMAGIIEGFRWAILGTDSPSWGIMVTSAVVTCIMLLGGILYFRRFERTFADVI